jgi:DEAD/DEAH box helicase domain-containing protein
MPLVCLNCHTTTNKQVNFFQISRKLKGIPFKREIKQPTNGIHVTFWEKDDITSLADGVYCQTCNSEINKDFLSSDERALFKDIRMETFSFKDYPIQEVISHIKNVGTKLGSSVEQYSLHERQPVYGDLEKPLPELLTTKLVEEGIDRFYSHQAEAINRVRKGENVVITTGTASGKSMVYTIPALESFINNDDSTVLYLSPLKALTRDQLQSLDSFDYEGKGEDSSFGYKTIKLGDTKIGAGVLEGGKSDSVKELTYQSARYWLTNVHYLHFLLQGPVHYLKNKKNFIRFFSNLKYVIIDELHAYNGVLGSKVAMLMRRLRNLCKALGNTNLQFIACSASIGNPKELAEEITGLKGNNGFALIDQEGSPTYNREILLWNPGLLEQKLEHRTRRAPISEAIEILKAIAGHYKMLPKTIFFYGNRRATTTASFDLNNALRSKLGEVLDGVDISSEMFSPFHAQLNSYKKQEIMSKLKKGELTGIVSTSALEMGIDIGDLNVCIMIGYAGSKASFLQQAGRVGRKGPGLVIQIFQEDPLERYYASNPIEFMEREPENVTINVSNPTIVAEHLQYAAHELNGSISSPHNFFKVSAAKKAENFLDKMVETTRGTWSLIEPELKYNNLLSSSKLYTVVHKQGATTETLYEGVDERSLLRDYHQNAVFLYNQRTYKVSRILSKKNEIWAVPIKAEYTTRSQINDSLYVVNEVKTTNINNWMNLGRGQLEITRRLWGYKKVNLFGGATSEMIQDNTMYPVTYKTEGLWIQIPDRGVSDGPLHVVEHAIASAIPTIVKCSHSDFSLLSSTNLKEFDYIPTIVCYESGGGGAGIMEAVEERILHIFKKGLGILKSCPCSSGCPNCTHLSMCEKNNEPLDKANGILLMEQFLSTFDNLEDIEVSSKK